ncbi:MAG TPA: undecaprenyl-diphosphate phosphatase [Roseiflexaceae bacterium]|nr:undecaprenyl-diphosphate phosphatase [Roseiflexaceae bacterium]
MQETSSPAAPSMPRAAFRPTMTIFAAVTVVACVLLSLVGYVQPVIMGIVQGLGEFLPISSSAHLILVPWFFGWQGGVIDSLTFDVALHLGTLVALLGYFWRDWLALLHAVPGAIAWALRYLGGDRASKRTPDEHILISIILATIPGAVLGVMLEKTAERSLRAPLLISVTLAVMGVLLYTIDHWRAQAKPLELISWRDSLLIGFAQACALIPGVSRSGGTITMGRWLTFDRQAAARFSFLLSAPITAAAVLVKLPDILSIPRSEIDVFLIGVLISGAVGALAIGFLLDYIRRAGFGIFAVYRIVLAVIVVLVYNFR